MDAVRHTPDPRSLTATSLHVASSRSPSPCPANRALSRHRINLWSLLGLLVMAAATPAGVAAAETVWTVEKLNDTKPWDRFLDSPLAIRVEGRVGGFGGGQLRLLRCDAKFIVDSQKLRNVIPKSTIELTGRFRKVDSKLEFAVEELRVVPGYVEQFESRAARLKRATSAEWNELGDWIAALGRFYEDADLLKKGDEAYLKAIETDHASLKPDDAAGRFELATKVDERKLPPRRKMELLHEGLQIQWQTMQKATPVDLAAWQDFTEKLGDPLPGTTTPLTSPNRDLQKRYELDPVATYRKATDEQRIQLHRFFFISATRKRLLHDASLDGRDGERIADQILELIPEESELAEVHRRQSLAYRVLHVESATRSEIEDLATQLRERKQQETADQALLKWVKSHELRLKGDGIVGLLQLSEEYLTLLRKEAEAVEYLSDAYRIDPGYEEVKSRLAALGYEWRNSRWVKSVPGRPAGVTTPEASPTGIYLGMTSTALREMLGEPRSLTRAITSRGITEVWSYGPPGNSRLVIRLEKKSNSQEPKVTNF
ncbi:hypothetical protein [Schlesneria sp. DSM 10557]|uniref:hypothetical protein n=1 Tax=Schlesneria sp. DSM 10557 TaxID=3044399 RepID=UPI00359FAA96